MCCRIDKRIIVTATARQHRAGVVIVEFIRELPVHPNEPVLSISILEK
jgi:hypothetical protein